MTCIVALRNGEDIILGADRCTSFNNSIIRATEPKIMKREIIGKNKNINIFMGLTGYSVHSSFLKYGFDIPEYDNSILFKKYLYKSFLPEFKKQLEENGLLRIEDNKNKLDGCFLIIFEDKIYKITTSLGLVDVSSLDYYSVGSGSYHAEGSLYSTKNMNISPKDRIKIAIKAAAHHLSGVDDNIDIEIIKPTDYIRCDNRNNKENIKSNMYECPYCKEKMGYQEVYDEWDYIDNIFEMKCPSCEKKLIVEADNNIVFYIKKKINKRRTRCVF